MPTTDALPRLLRIGDLCAWSGFSRGKIYRLWREGRGPKRLVVENIPVVRREDAESWLANLIADASKPSAPTKSTRGENPHRRKADGAAQAAA
jgi:hypothetical protein